MPTPALSCAIFRKGNKQRIYLPCHQVTALSNLENRPTTRDFPDDHRNARSGCSERRILPDPRVGEELLWPCGAFVFRSGSGTSFAVLRALMLCLSQPLYGLPVTRHEPVPKSLSSVFWDFRMLRFAPNCCSNCCSHGEAPVLQGQTFLPPTMVHSTFTFLILSGGILNKFSEISTKSAYFPAVMVPRLPSTKFA